MFLYEKRITVLQEHLDERNHVNNVQYVSWIQDISKEHWEAVAPANLLESHFWVVRNHNITYKNAAFLGDELLVKTHISQNTGALSIRDVQITNIKTGKCCLEAQTQWCLIDAQSLKPVRIPGIMAQLFLS